MKSFDEMEEEEQELNALAPEFMDGDVVLGKVNDVPSFPVFKGGDIERTGGDVECGGVCVFVV